VRPHELVPDLIEDDMPCLQGRPFRAHRWCVIRPIGLNLADALPMMIGRMSRAAEEKASRLHSGFAANSVTGDCAGERLVDATRAARRQPAADTTGATPRVIV
jgi:hypothetical protein